MLGSYIPNSRTGKGITVGTIAFYSLVSLSMRIAHVGFMLNFFTRSVTPFDQVMNLPPLTKELLLTVYRWSTRQKRNALAREFRMNGNYPATILFYHRVANVGQNGWTISHENFKRHMDWIEANSKFASLDDIRKSQINGHRTIPMVGLTFDDGYGENNDFANPSHIGTKDTLYLFRFDSFC